MIYVKVMQFVQSIYHIFSQPVCALYILRTFRLYNFTGRFETVLVSFILARMTIVQNLLERGMIPDRLIRKRIRRLLAERIAEETAPGEEQQQERLHALIARMDSSPVAIQTEAANAQHYELPARFFQYVLGSHLKYSACYWEPQCTSLDEAELRALEITVERAGIEDGQQILELGCGWGSLTLFMAKRFPHSRILAVSNASSQRRFIEGRCREEGLGNVAIVTADMNDFTTTSLFDRVISVEMFEHMRNYRLLLKKIAGFLATDGKLFIHIFTHKEFAYFFDAENSGTANDHGDWMSRYFFTGGIMPSDHLLYYFNADMHVVRHWRWDGTHYGKTVEAWLHNLDANRDSLLSLFGNVYGENEKRKHLEYWRIFFMACAELWNFRKGREWMVSHYLLEKNTEWKSSQ